MTTTTDPQLFFCCMRRRKQSPGGKGGWYEPGPTHDAADTPGLYKQGGDDSSYPMAPFAATPHQPFAHSRSESMATMATADLAAHAPVKSESGFGLSDHAQAQAPYRDLSPGHERGGYAMAGYHPSAEADYPRQQTYRPVNY